MAGGYTDIYEPGFETATVDTTFDGQGGNSIESVLFLGPFAGLFLERKSGCHSIWDFAS